MSTGKEKLLRQMKADGVEYIFGNPGTVEQGPWEYIWPNLRQKSWPLQETGAVCIQYRRFILLPGTIFL